MHTTHFKKLNFDVLAIFLKIIRSLVTYVCHKFNVRANNCSLCLVTIAQTRCVCARISYLTMVFRMNCNNTFVSELINVAVRSL